MRVITYKTRKGTEVPTKKLYIYDKECEGPQRSKARVGDIVKIDEFYKNSERIPKCLKGAKHLKVSRIETREKSGNYFLGKYRDTIYVLQNPKTGKTAKLDSSYFNVVVSKCRRKHK